MIVLYSSDNYFHDKYNFRSLSGNECARHAMFQCSMYICIFLSTNKRLSLSSYHSYVDGCGSTLIALVET
jgi:hypothetical protein